MGRQGGKWERGGREEGERRDRRERGGREEGERRERGEKGREEGEKGREGESYVCSSTLRYDCIYVLYV